MAVEQGILHEEDFMNKSEREIMDVLEHMSALRQAQGPQKLQRPRGVAEPVEAPHQNQLTRLYNTFRTMTSIEHTAHALPPEEYFCVSLNVKQRYIDPLVASGSLSLSKGRLSAISPFAKKIIDDFKAYHDTPFGCVKLIRH